MKTTCPSTKRTVRKYDHLITLVIATLVSIFLVQNSAADDRRVRSPITLSGMYKVATSNDPLFPARPNSEWFFDFGKGTQTGANSGTVAVSLRENPKVSVRIMVWQYLPAQHALVIGNQYSRGSGNAVAKAVWTIGNDSNEILLARAGCAMVLHRADPRDY